MRTLSRIALTVALLTVLSATPLPVVSQGAPTYTFAAVNNMRFDPRFSRSTIKAAEQEQQIILDQGRIKQTIDYNGYLMMNYLAKTEKDSPRFFADLKPAN